MGCVCLRLYYPQVVGEYLSFDDFIIAKDVCQMRRIFAHINRFDYPCYSADFPAFPTGPQKVHLFVVIVELKK